MRVKKKRYFFSRGNTEITNQIASLIIHENEEMLGGVPGAMNVVNRMKCSWVTEDVLRLLGFRSRSKIKVKTGLQN